MKIQSLSIPDVKLIEPSVFKDARGFFMETYRQDQHAEHGIGPTFVQDNHSGSRQGVLRGLHYQIQNVQGKLVRAIKGKVFDVAVDLRKSSANFGKWTGVILSEDEHTELWVPPGFAHGFYVLSAWAEIVYKVTDYYSPEWECTLKWDDPQIGIEWPLIEGQPPNLSNKDADGLSFEAAPHFD